MQRYDPAVGPCIKVIIIHPVTRERVPVTGLVDTGSSISAVKTVALDKYARHIGEGAVNANHLQTTLSKKYEANVRLELGDAPPIEFPVPGIITLYEFQRPEHERIDMLVGRDILRFGFLVVDGPRSQFEFRITRR
jgi:hypothetical protein